MFAKVLLTLPILRTVDDLHNQFIMQLKIGVGESNTLPMPQLYKEVYDLPSKAAQGRAEHNNHQQNGVNKVATTSSSCLKAKEEVKEYSSCQRGNTSALPASSAPHNHGTSSSSSSSSSSTSMYFPTDLSFVPNAGPHSTSFEHPPVHDMGSFRHHHPGVSMGMGGYRPSTSSGPCKQGMPFGMPYKHNSHSGAFRHQMSSEENHVCNHMNSSSGSLHHPVESWSSDVERDFHILSRNIKKEPDYDTPCI